MSHGSMRGQQPPLLARPSHGLLARHGWVWLAGPGAALLVAGVAVSVVFESTPETHQTEYTLAGFALLIGLALIVIGVPVRALVVRSHRRRWTPDQLPSIGGRYPMALDAEGGAPSSSRARGGHRPRRSAAFHLVVGALLCLLAVGIVVVTAAIAVSGLADGIRAIELHHSSSTVRVQATLDRDTRVVHGRGTTYTDHVSYVVDGRTEHNVTISPDGAQKAGDTIAVLVDRDDPGNAIAASDSGYGDLIGGGIGALSLIITAALLVSGRSRKGRKGRRRRGRRKRPATAGAG